MIRCAQLHDLREIPNLLSIRMTVRRPWEQELERVMIPFSQSTIYNLHLSHFGFLEKVGISIMRGSPHLSASQPEPPVEAAHLIKLHLVILYMVTLFHCILYIGYCQMVYCYIVYCNVLLFILAFQVTHDQEPQWIGLQL